MYFLTSASVQKSWCNFRLERVSAGDAQLVAPSLRAIAELARAQAPKKLLASAKCLLTEGGSNPAEIKTDLLIWYAQNVQGHHRAGDGGRAPRAVGSRCPLQDAGGGGRLRWHKLIIHNPRWWMDEFLINFFAELFGSISATASRKIIAESQLFYRTNL